jgi:AP endonuclease 1
MNLTISCVYRNLRLASKSRVHSFLSLSSVHIAKHTLRGISSSPMASTSKSSQAKAEDTEQPSVKRIQSSGKRKASSDASDDEPQPSASKKPKGAKAAADSGLSASKQPTNKVLPTNISFSPKTEGALRIASWNICGLAAASKKV